MIDLNPHPRGYQVHLPGEVDHSTAREFNFSFRNEMAGSSGAFALIIDARDLDFFHADALAQFESTLESVQPEGLKCICVLASSTVHAPLFCDMMLRSGLMDAYHYLDVAYDPDWSRELEEILAEV